MEREIKNRIVAGFPGVGKSFAMKYEDGYNGIFLKDSDSSQYPKDGFPENYIASIKRFDTSSFNYVFISTHKLVRDCLLKEGIVFTLVFPNVHLKGEYIQRFIDRKNPKAFIDLMYNNWESWLDEIKIEEGYEKIELQKGEYLSNYLKL